MISFDNLDVGDITVFSFFLSFPSCDLNQNYGGVVPTVDEGFERTTCNLKYMASGFRGTNLLGCTVSLNDVL
jgi:hypothetical protein